MTNFVLISLAGPALLVVFRRAARKANFEAVVHFDGVDLPERDPLAEQPTPRYRDPAAQRADAGASFPGLTDGKGWLR